MKSIKKISPKKLARILGLASVFGFSFVTFLFFTFPYEVLKEMISGELSEATGYAIEIGDMTSAFPLGVKASNISLVSPGGNERFVLDRAKMRVSVLALMIGRVSLSADLEAKSGSLNLAGGIGIFDLLRGLFLPKWVSLDANGFPLSELVGFVLGSMSSSPTANPMVAPLLSSIGVNGFLTGAIEFSFDSKNPVQSSGKAMLAINKAELKLSNPTLGLPDQIFKKAELKAKVENGSLILDKSSGFIAEEIEILPEGKVSLKPTMSSSLLDMNIQIKLHGGLKEKFGFIIDAVTGTATGDGQLTTQLRGPLEAPVVTTF